MTFVGTSLKASYAYPPIREELEKVIGKDCDIWY